MRGGDHRPTPSFKAWSKAVDDLMPHVAGSSAGIGFGTSGKHPGWLCCTQRPLPSFCSADAGIPRPTYVKFRNIFDSYFKYEAGFIILGNEFFKIPGRFPISFTIWSYQHNDKGNRNKVILRDLTHLKHDDLAINWNQGIASLETTLKAVIKGTKTINYSADRESIKEWCGQ